MWSRFGLFMTIGLLVSAAAFPLKPPRKDQHDFSDLINELRKLVEADGKRQQYLLRVPANGKVSRVTIDIQPEDLVAAADTFGHSGTAAAAAAAAAQVDRDNAAAVLFSFWSTASVFILILPAAYCAFRILKKKQTGDIETGNSRTPIQEQEMAEVLEAIPENIEANFDEIEDNGEEMAETTETIETKAEEEGKDEGEE
jgi:hypothetical protein